MTFTEISDAIKALTKRPEKSVEIALAINRAVSFFTLKADFRQDLLEDSLDLDATAFGQVVDISTLTLPQIQVHPAHIQEILSQAD